MTLSQAPDGGVATHLTNAVEIHGEQHGLTAHPCRSQGRLDSRMSRSYDDNIVVFGEGKTTGQAH